MEISCHASAIVGRASLHMFSVTRRLDPFDFLRQADKHWERKKRAQKGNDSSVELVEVGDLALYLLVEIRIKIIVLVLSLDKKIYCIRI